jgi:hypothetical protein
MTISGLLAPASSASQQMEILRGRRGVADLKVVLSAKLKEAFEPRARMLRPLTFVAVWEQQTETKSAATCPLRGDELIDDHLGAVSEIAELGLPEHQAVAADIDE